ncbi:hypothetical protein ES676_03185 [Bizionia saleffrena]|uniref:Signal transduction histidine kinase internal region domain-containing protein n=1 Tax=Bizionia saleffrena TaxID=291189 RepID=A0A8H2QMB6_9FLAO|nr:histidine kinase [Bizionia saleffrena]TYB77310.1 hypothetical protein ES676_03185 [Bizionia saleffrena]
MKHKKWHITLLLLLLWNVLFAQQYTNYSTKDGLPSNHVYTIMQDAKGYMWFLTDKGMVKYNGKTFKTFTTKEGLPINDVWDAFVTPDGKIWYLSKSSRLGFIENDSVFSFPNMAKNEIMNPIFSSQIQNSVYPNGPNKMFTLKDTIWEQIKEPENKLGNKDFVKIINNSNVSYLTYSYTTDNLIVYDENSTILKQFHAKNTVYHKTSRGQITENLFFWVSDKKYYILNFDTLEFKTFTFKDEIDIDSVKHARINVVGDTFQISGASFVGYLDENFHISKPFFFPPHLNAHFGFIDNKNTIWLSTFNKGVYKLPDLKQNIIYDFEGDKIQNLNRIHNNLIASVYNQGFFKYAESDKTFKPYLSVNDYIYGASEITALNTAYYFTPNIIFKEFRGERPIATFKKESLNPEYATRHLKKVVLFNSELYAIYSFGIYKIDDETFKIKADISQRGSNDLLVFNCRLIIATNSGLKEIENDAVKNVIFKTQTFKKPVLSIKPLSETELLINTDGFGSFISDLDTIRPLNGSEFLIVQDAFVKDNTIWLATNTGVLHLEKNNGEYQLVKSYGVNDGLPNNNVNSIFVDNQDLIVGTNNGLAILPIHQETQNLLLDVFIEKATYNDEVITECDNTFLYTSNNVVNLKSDIINFSEDNEILLNYKLEPIQNEWITTSSTIFNFNNLKPDHYTFNLESGTIKKQLSFTILPLWWQALWVKIMLVLIVVAVIAYLVWVVSKSVQLKKNNALIQEKMMIEIQLKALRSQMNPHFVFNSLAAIQYYINNNEIEASETYLVKFSKLIRQFFELSKETEISLNEEIKLIQNYLDIEKLRFKDKFQYHINCDDTVNTKQVKLPTMLLQPIVENAINHGIFNKVENGNVFVNVLYISEKSFKVEIIDDGVGFVNTQKPNNRKIKSSNVLEDRLKFLNKTGQWSISCTEEELNPKLSDRGSVSTFIITQL